MTRPGGRSLSRLTGVSGIPILAGAAGILLGAATYHVLTWRRFVDVVDVCPRPFCDFVDYYYPMGEAVLRTGLPVEGFLYSPFNAIVLALFPPLGLDASLVLWGVLEVLLIFLYLRLFRRLIPAGSSIQLLFLALVLFSFPLRLNFLAGQVSTFMIVAVLGTFVLHERHSRAGAAGLIAFGASFKYYPVIFLAPFAARRDARFLLLAAVTCGVVFLAIPAFFLGGAGTLGFYDALLDSLRDSGWVVSNPHSQFFPHVVLRLVEGTAQATHPYLSHLRWMAYGVVAANVGLLFLVQRKRLRYAEVWSLNLLFLMTPFFLKTSWPHDFAFLPLTQAFLAWQLTTEESVARRRDGAETLPHAGPWRGRATQARRPLAFVLLGVSIIFSNVVFFDLLGDFVGYGSVSFLFWANLLLLTASYVILLPSALRGHGSRDTRAAG